MCWGRDPAQQLAQGRHCHHQIHLKGWLKFALLLALRNLTKIYLLFLSFPLEMGVFLEESCGSFVNVGGKLSRAPSMPLQHHHEQGITCILKLKVVSSPRSAFYFIFFINFFFLMLEMHIHLMLPRQSLEYIAIYLLLFIW